uniref:F-box domain-containing protein n=1 Tax=Spongospora subterranea TaxID=70186 RepID=A0A0H5R868_9EUKA|eukprot:CRZ10031.1 hypothetical protein [Spongospora subterranea]
MSLNKDGSDPIGTSKLGFNDLSIDVLVDCLFEFLDPESIAALASLNRQFTSYMSDDCQEIWRRLVSTKIKDALEIIPRKSWKAIYIDSSSGFTINRIGELNDFLFRANSPFRLEKLVLGVRGCSLKREGETYFEFNEDIKIPIGAFIKSNDEIVVNCDDQVATVFRVVQTGIWPSSYLYRGVACKKTDIPQVFPLVGGRRIPKKTSKIFDRFLLRHDSVIGHINFTKRKLKLERYLSNTGGLNNIAKYLQNRSKAIKIVRNTLFSHFYQIQTPFCNLAIGQFKTIDEALANLNAYLAPEREPSWRDLPAFK